MQNTLMDFHSNNTPQILYEILNGKYRYVFKDMLIEDFFILEDRAYDLFSPICCDNKVVGYVAGDFINSQLKIYIVYIIREYRNQGLFNKKLIELMIEFGVNGIIIDKPNRFLIMSLLKHKIAFNVSENIIKVVKPFSLSFETDTGEVIVSRCYDLKKCGVIKDGLISPVLSWDKEYFDADKYR